MKMLLRRVALLAVLFSVVACSDSAPGVEPSDTEKEIEENYGNRYLFKSLVGKDADEIETGALDPVQRQTLLERGDYLVNGPAACGACHSATERPGSPLSGGRMFQDRFGPVRAANITSSKETGIGNWRRVEIARAIRSALGKDEVALSLDLHATYRWMSDSDAKAISVYLQSTPAVESTVERRDLGTFEKNRMGIFSRYRKVEGFVPAPPQSKSSAYGRYLSYHVAGCYGCHTPEGGIVDDAIPFSGVPARDRSLIGSFKALFSLMSPKSTEEGAGDNAPSVSLLSPEAQKKYQVDDSLSAPAAQPDNTARGRIGANEKYDEAIDTGALPVSGPDIRSSGDAGISGWTKDELIAYLSGGKTPKGEIRDGRVCPWPYFMHMSDNDKEAIAIFLKKQ